MSCRKEKISKTHNDRGDIAGATKSQKGGCFFVGFGDLVAVPLHHLGRSLYLSLRYIIGLHTPLKPAA